MPCAILPLAILANSANSIESISWSDSPHSGRPRSRRLSNRPSRSIAPKSFTASN